ncbi:ketoacyl-ACP synthase III [Roseateles asaccharophilus]|uniref:3-oxoacyl-[acyl-carrier-protein] synthase-3 n=1 Tax=Roseateles asaccharophilus TaxID=582607 RepID=A0ABU2ABX4_9BURK|nr:ketoacyl-ACP synthase III [Roseateles asaccharophilus]MDR7334701.1 3-oxoacyl-[acyl-carrier-protein] synthase-3 [Roseateles asaccharophilus]
MNPTNTPAGKYVRVEHVALRGVVSASPKTEIRNQDLTDRFSPELIEEIGKMTGVRTRRVATEEQTTSDLSEAAARALMADLGWEPDSVDAIVFVSQTPDYRLPATACALQSRLGLGTHCAAFDVNLGCSGYVYGLWLASKLIDGHAVRRVLLLAGDTSSKLVDPQDRATALLFGDAGTATALEFDATASPTSYVLGTDGRGEKNLIIPKSTYRGACGAGDLPESNPDYLYMNGPEVFNFTIRSVPMMVNAVLEASGKSVNGIGCALFHQANAFMLKHIAKKLKLPAEKFPLNIDRFGNTSSATIPLLMATLDDKAPLAGDVVMAGFGVGYSWAAAHLSLNTMTVCRWIEV